MNCNYKVKITDIQNKYQFKILCKGGANSTNVNDIYNLLPTTTTEGTDISISNTADIKAKSITIKGNTTQDGTPTPSSPIDVVNVTGLNTIKVKNKNLIVDETFIQGGSANDAANRISCRNIKLKANTTYTLSSTLNYNNFNINICTLETEFPHLAPYNYDSGWKSASITFTTGNSDVYSNIAVRKSNDANLTPSDIAGAKFQLEVGSTATSYVAHQEKNYNINLGSMELCKIGTYQDYIYKKDGKWWKHKEISKYILNGGNNENWLLNSSALYYKYQWATALPDKYNIADTPLYCNYFKQITVLQGDSKYIIGIANGLYSGYSLQIISDISTLSDFKTWLSTNKPEVYYILATPIEEEITDSTLIRQLNNISNNIRTFEGGTDISLTSAGANPIINITTFNKLS